MTFIVSSYIVEVFGEEDVHLEMPNFFLEDLEKVGKTFFQSLG
jgi:hypothetical protein